MGRTISLYNTCPIDNMLMLIHYALGNKYISAWFEENAEKLEVCKILLEIHNTFLAKNWCDGRAIWLQKYCAVPQSDHWDLFGSEWQHFVQHFAHIQETESVSTCSKRRCSQKSRLLMRREIILGDRTLSAQISLDESLKQWEEEFRSPCLAGPPDNRCSGERTCTARRFTIGDPPVLILNVSFLSEARGLSPSQLPPRVTIGKSRYTIFAFTMGDGKHFRAFFIRSGSWFMYDGLFDPEVTRVSLTQATGQMEHVIVIKENMLTGVPS